MFHSLRPWFLLVVLGCSSPAPPPERDARTDSFKALCEEWHKALRDKDTKKAADIVRGVCPNEARYKKGLKEDLPAGLDQTIKLLAMGRDVEKGSDDKIAWGLQGEVKLDQTEVRVHRATTEELIRYEPGSVAARRFPRVAHDMAVKVLRPKMTYYVAEFMEPGKDQGTRTHLFFWDGTQWTLLGEIIIK